MQNAKESTSRAMTLATSTSLEIRLMQKLKVKEGESMTATARTALSCILVEIGQCGSTSSPLDLHEAITAKARDEVRGEGALTSSVGPASEVQP